MGESRPLLGSQEWISIREDPYYLQLLPKEIIRNAFELVAGDEHALAVRTLARRVESDRKTAYRWRASLVAASALVFGLAIAVAYLAWPARIDPCTPYSCDAFVDWQWCWNHTWNGTQPNNDTVPVYCQYYWSYSVDGVEDMQTWVVDSPPWSWLYYSNSTDQPPFLNGTTCYYPASRYCDAPESSWPGWVNGRGSWGCQPVFACPNLPYYPGRLAFALSASLGFGFVYALLLLYACCRSAN